MNSQPVFTECQRVRQWWAWFILVAVNGIFAYAIYQQVLCGVQLGNNPPSDIGLVIAGASMLLFTAFVGLIHLDTTIKHDGVYVRFFPFHLRFKCYHWDTITKSYIRKYSPIFEYGGWGIRLGIFGKGAAYNMSGNMGLQLVFSDTKKLLIGTCKPDELRKALEEIGQYNE